MAFSRYNLCDRDKTLVIVWVNYGINIIDVIESHTPQCCYSSFFVQRFKNTVHLNGTLKCMFPLAIFLVHTHANTHIRQ